MSTLEIAILAVALAVDAFSVAAAVGPSCCPRWGAKRLAGSFGLFQAAMPLLGALAGAYLVTYVRAYDHWVAFGLLEFIGAKMIFDAYWPGKAAAASRKPGLSDPSRGSSLLALSIATSIDAFGAGVGMRIVGANLWVACPTIGVAAAALTYAGASLGVAAEKYVGRKAALVGGMVLLALGFRMLRI